MLIPRLVLLRNNVTSHVTHCDYRKPQGPTVLFEPIYSLPAATGIPAPVTKAAESASAGYSGGMFYLPHGAPYADEFRKDRAPTPRELIRQITGVAYACAHLNADAVASTRLRLFVRTAPNELVTRWAARPVATKVVRQLGRGRTGAAFAVGGSKIEEITDHPLLRLLDVQHIGVGASDPEAFDEDANDDDGQPDLSGHDLIYLTQLYLESLGRAYWLLPRRPGRPAAGPPAPLAPGPRGPRPLGPAGGRLL